MVPIPALIAAGASIIGQGASALSQSSINRKTREYNEKMYAKQRADSLQDWNMQNQYNSPAEQMRRLKSAGLNPNLVYGEGAVANNSSLPRQVQMDNWKPEAPRYDGSGIAQSMSSIYDIQLKTAQTDNLKATNEVLKQDALLRAAQTASTVAGTARSKFDLGQAQTLSQYVIEQAKANLNATQTGTDINLQANERAAAQSAQSLQKGAEEILSIRLGRAKTEAERNLILQQMASVQKDVRLKQLDIDLKEQGIQPGDPMWSRVLARILEDTVGSENVIKKLSEGVKKGANILLDGGRQNDRNTIEKLKKYRGIK